MATITIRNRTDVVNFVPPSALWRDTNALNGPREFLEKSGSREEATLLVPRLRPFDFGCCGGMEPNAH
jgi:hypothetical protein